LLYLPQISAEAFKRQRLLQDVILSHPVLLKLLFDLGGEEAATEGDARHLLFGQSVGGEKFVDPLDDFDSIHPNHLIVQYNQRYVVLTLFDKFRLNKLRKIETFLNVDGLLVQLKLFIDHVAHVDLVKLGASVNNDLILGVICRLLGETEVNRVQVLVFNRDGSHIEGESCAVLKVRNVFDISFELNADELAYVEAQASTSLATAPRIIES
jgi:hypothetical protein